MKKNSPVTSSLRQYIASWAKSVSFVLLIAAFVACLLDVFVVSPGTLSVSILGYVVVIGTGVALQFVASALPNMKFRLRSKSKNDDGKTEILGTDSLTIVEAKPHRIDDDEVVQPEIRFKS